QPVLTVEPKTEAHAKTWRETLPELQKINALFGNSDEKLWENLTRCIDSIPSADLPVAVVELQKLQAQNSTPAGHELLRRLLLRWAEKDVLSAAKWINQMPSDEDRNNGITALSKTWAKQNFDEAAAWAAQLPDAAERQRAQETIAAEAKYSNPMDAL